MLQEIEGRWVKERFRNGDFVIATIELVNGSTEIAAKHGHELSEIAVKGDASPDEVSPRGCYMFYGQFGEYKGQKDFKFTSFVPVTAHDKDGVVAYLEQAGKGLGLGRATINKCWDRWGSDAVRELREDPQQLLLLSNHVSWDQCEEIGRKLRAQQKLESATIELINLFAGRKIPKATARKAIKEWGNRAAQVIKRDPYKLMRFRGIGFKTADHLWIEFGLRKDRLRRQAMAVWHFLASNSDGHVWFPVEQAEQYLHDTIRGANVDALRAIKMATRINRMMPNHYGAVAACRMENGAIVERGGKIMLAVGSKAAAESNLADWITEGLTESKPVLTSYEAVEVEQLSAVDHVRCHRCSRQLTAPDVHIVGGKPYGPTCVGYIDGEAEMITLVDWLDRNQAAKTLTIMAPKGRIQLPDFSLWPEPSTIKNITEHQREAIGNAITGRIGILGGSPGTGKSYTLAQLIKATLAGGRVGVDDCLVAAPTGKAAVRVSEYLAAAQLPMRAVTLHKALGISQPEDGGDWGFAFNRDCRWPYKVVFIDELSMVDNALASAVFAARAKGTHVLMVGDVNQLAPVGYGAPMRDFIVAGIPYGELTEIHRNEGGIVQACADIRDLREFLFCGNLVHLHASNAEQQISVIRDKIAELSTEYDPIWDCQILAAVNEKSKVSRVAINSFFQDELNENGKIEGSPFRIDDKVVCLKNGYYPVVDADPEAFDSEDPTRVYVANGELGLIVGIHDKKYEALLSSPRRQIIIPRGKPVSSESSDGEESGSGIAWDTAYGLTCHKLQGSEAPIVFVVIDENASRLCTREWIYTAMSRAKVCCYIVGKEATMRHMCRRTALGNRRTLLAQKIRKGLCRTLVEWF